MAAPLSSSNHDYDMPEEDTANLTVTEGLLGELGTIDEHLSKLYEGGFNTKRLSYGTIRTRARSDYSLSQDENVGLAPPEHKPSDRDRRDSTVLRKRPAQEWEPKATKISLFRYVRLHSNVEAPQEKEQERPAKNEKTIDEKIEAMDKIRESSEKLGHLPSGKLPPLRQFVKPEVGKAQEAKLIKEVTKKYYKRAVNTKSRPFSVQLDVQHRYHQRRDPPTQLKDNFTKRLNELMIERQVASENKMAIMCPGKTLRKRYRTRGYRVEEEEEEERTRLASIAKETPTEKFRRCAQLVIVFWRCCEAFENMAIEAGLMKAGTQTGPVKKKMTAEDGSEAGAILWDLSYFRCVKKDILDRDIIYALQKRSNLRTPQEIKVIAHGLSKFTALKKYTPELLYRFSRVATYIKVDKKRTVIRKGHISWTIYFIFSGCVSVVQDVDTESQRVKQDAVFLKRGAIFGEVGVLHDMKRTATITTAEECEFIMVDKDDFIKEGLHESLQDLDYRKYQFYRDMPCLRYLDDELMESLARLSRIESFGYNEIIVRDSSVNHWLWFILEGACNVLRFVPLENLADYDFLRELPCNKRLLTQQETKMMRLKKVRNSLKSTQIISSKERREQQLRDDEEKRHSYNAALMEVPSASQADRIKVRSMSAVGATLDLEPTEELKSLIASLMSSDKNTNNKNTNNKNSNNKTFNNKNTNKKDTNKENTNNENTSNKNTNNRSNNNKSSTREEFMDTCTSEGVYVHLDRFEAGRCFGLDIIYDETRARRYSNTLVSDRCVILQVPIQTFASHVNYDVLLQMQLQVHHYPSNFALMTRFVKHNIWNMFKRITIENKIVEVIQAKGMYSNLRGDAGRIYSRAHKLPDITYKRPRDKKAQRKAPVGTLREEGAAEGGISATDRFGIAARSEIPYYGLKFNPDFWTVAEENKILFGMQDAIDEGRLLEETEEDKIRAAKPPVISTALYKHIPSRKLSVSDKADKVSVLGRVKPAYINPRKMTEHQVSVDEFGRNSLPMVETDMPDFTTSLTFRLKAHRSERSKLQAELGMGRLRESQLENEELAKLAAASDENDDLKEVAEKLAALDKSMVMNKQITVLPPITGQGSAENEADEDRLETIPEVAETSSKKKKGGGGKKSK